MKSFDVVRRALLSGAAAMLAGCGGSQGPIGAPDEMSQNSIFGHGRKASGSNSALLYVVTKGAVAMLTYPQGKKVGSFTTNEAAAFICSDPRNGDVFVPQFGEIERYAYAGTTPIATLTPPPNVGGLGGCSVDPTTGNLAVVAGPIGSKENKGFVLVYNGGEGKATTYSSAKMRLNVYPAYDSSGNLFVIGYDEHETFALNELASGENKFMHITGVNGLNLASKDQWDGTYLTIALPKGTIAQVQISGSSGTVANYVNLQYGDGGYYWIQDGSIVEASTMVQKKNNIGIGIWPYPAGGPPSSILYGIAKGKKQGINDLTVTVAPSR
jgi:hypothetical protein